MTAEPTATSPAASDIELADLIALFGDELPMSPERARVARNIARCLKNKGIGSWRVSLKQAIRPVFNSSINRDL